MFEDDDIEADIRAALDSGPAEPVTVEPIITPEATPGIDDASDAQAKQTSQDNTGKVRDESGRFAKKDEVANPLEKAQPLTASPEVTPEPPKETIRPPTSWSATAKSKFAALDPDIQKEILKREGDIEGGKAQWDAKGERLNRFDAIVSTRKERLALAGLDEFSAIQSLFAAQDYLERDPQGAIAYLARQYGATLPGGPQAPQLQQQAPQGYQQQIQQPDPQLLTLSQQVQALTQHLHQQQEAQSAAELGRVQSSVEAFRKDNLYFDNVRGAMGKLIEAGLATDLPDAYDKACYADPEIRALRLAEANPAPTAQTQSQAPGTPAGLSVVGSPGLSRPSGEVNPNSSIEDDVRQAMQSLAGRA